MRRLSDLRQWRPTTHSLPVVLRLLVLFFSEKKPHAKALGNLFISDENTAV